MLTKTRYITLRDELVLKQIVSIMFKSIKDTIGTIQKTFLKFVNSVTFGILKKSGIL